MLLITPFLISEGSASLFSFFFFFAVCSVSHGCVQTVHHVRKVWDMLTRPFAESENNKTMVLQLVKPWLVMVIFYIDHVSIRALLIF